MNLERKLFRLYLKMYDQNVFFFVAYQGFLTQHIQKRSIFIFVGFIFSASHPEKSFILSKLISNIEQDEPRRLL